MAHPLGEPGTPQPPAVRRRQIIFGIMLVAAGLMMFLHQLTLFHAFHFWPLFVIAVGVLKMGEACCRHQVRSGAWLVAFGGWFALNEFTGLRYRDTWPLMLLIVGAFMVWNGFAPEGRCEQCSEGRHGR